MVTDLPNTLYWILDWTCHNVGALNFKGDVALLVRVFMKISSDKVSVKNITLQTDIAR